MTDNRPEWEKDFDDEFCEKVSYGDGTYLYWKHWKQDDTNLIPTPSEIKGGTIYNVTLA